MKNKQIDHHSTYFTFYFHNNYILDYPLCFPSSHFCPHSPTHTRTTPTTHPFHSLTMIPHIHHLHLHLRYHSSDSLIHYHYLFPYSFFYYFLDILLLDFLLFVVVISLEDLLSIVDLGGLGCLVLPSCLVFVLSGFQFGLSVIIVCFLAVAVVVFFCFAI